MGFMWSADVEQTRGYHEELLEVAVYGLCQGRVRTVGERKCKVVVGGLLERKIRGRDHTPRPLPNTRTLHTQSRQKLFCLTVCVWEHSSLFALCCVTGTGQNPWVCVLKLASALATRVLMRKLKLQQIT